MKLSKIIIDKLTKKITGFTPHQIVELNEKNKSLENELKKVPLCQKYQLGIMGKKGFCIKNTIFEEKDINNSSKKTPFINPFSNSVAVIGESGSGKSLLTSKILSDSKKILYLGSIDRDYYKKDSQRNFRMILTEKDEFFFEKDDKTYHSHEINFYNMDREDVISIDISFLKINSNNIQPCYTIFETFIFNAIKNGYSIVFDESYVNLDDLLHIDIFSYLISFAYNRLKLELDQLKNESINNAKIVISLNNYIFKNVLHTRIACSYYIDELILVDSFNSKNIKSFQELEDTYSFFIGDYFKYHLIPNHTKVGDYIHFEKLEGGSR